MTEKSSNFFRDYLLQTDSRSIVKMDHYLDIYHERLGHRRGEDVTFLEIGIWRGGSIGLWKSFWGPSSQLTFLDIDPEAPRFAEDRVAIEIGDQADFAFMSEMAKRRGPFDVIVDDGGHKMNQQITSFKALWPHLKSDGLYIIEDVHSSYWPGFGGGYKHPGSAIEFAKHLVDLMNSWYTDSDDAFPQHPMRKELGSIAFYDSMIFIQKASKPTPVQVAARNGELSYSDKILKARNRRSIF